ncbi:helix-turn-helix domain-containing protein [Streptomyces sp. WM4235]|uniref:helix-turn-helix domain-containing protein n=1 Tax=Streptomyces sp. WM4235 TaxID=1415551 RepID=UPI00099C9516|nr:helix-turn-helix transcriptional regulator [Streptomyces sp. WM4235]
MDRDWARLGKALKAARQAIGLTQEQLAAELGVSRSVVQGIERGKPHSKPSLTMRAYARRVGWATDSIDEVLAGREPRLAAQPEAAAEPPAGLPLRIVDELADDGALLDTVVVPLGGDARMVVVVKGRPGASPEEIRRNLEAWRSAHQHLLEAVEYDRDGNDSPPSVASEA